MLPCDIIFYKRVGFINRLISWLTKSEYTHVALAVSDTEIIEANVFVNVRRIEFDKAEKVVIKRTRYLTHEQEKIILNYVNSKLGTKYDYLTIAKKAIHLLLKRDRAIVDNDIRVYCSEIVDRAYLKAGIDLVSNRVDGDVTPSDLYLSEKLIEVKMTG